MYSSWDEYATEVKSGRLEWSPVHRSDKFWVNLDPYMCIYICYAQSADLDHPRIFARKARIQALRSKS